MPMMDFSFGIFFRSMISRITSRRDLDKIERAFMNFLTYAQQLALSFSEYPAPMIEKQPLSHESVISCLQANYAIEVASLVFLPLGADLNAAVYKAQALDQRSYFIKLRRGHHHDLSVAIAELLCNAGVQQIIPPIKTIQNRATVRLNDWTLIVYPFVEGKDGFSRDLTENQWIQLGHALKQIHATKVPLSLQNEMRRETYSPQWRELLKPLFIHLEAEPNGDTISLKLTQFMKEHLQEIRRLVDRAEQLAQNLQKQSLEFVLCHSDIHGGNVLLKGKNTLYIVDWDDPILAPKERDLMFIGGGVANVWNKPQEERFFYKGYEKTDINFTALAYYRHERIVEDMAIYAQQLLLTVEGGEARQEMYKHFIAMFEPQGVVDIAFKTDENEL